MFEQPSFELNGNTWRCEHCGVYCVTLAVMENHDCTGWREQHKQVESITDFIYEQDHKDGQHPTPAPNCPACEKRQADREQGRLANKLGHLRKARRALEHLVKCDAELGSLPYGWLIINIKFREDTLVKRLNEITTTYYPFKVAIP